MRYLDLGALALLAACGSQEVSSQAQEGLPDVPSARAASSGIRLRVEGAGLRGAGEIVPFASLTKKDRPERMRALLGNAPASDLARLSGLPAGFDARPLLIDADAGQDLLRLFDALRALVSSGPPYFVNLALRTRQGEIGLPVLLPLKESPLKAPDGSPYDWYFFNEHRRVPYDWDPRPPMSSSEQSVTSVSLAPLETGEFLTQIAWGPFDLLPPDPLRRVGDPPAPPRTPLVALPAEAWGEEFMPSESDGTRLSGRAPEALEERRKRQVVDEKELDDPMNFRAGKWRVVPDAKALERVLAGVTGPRRPLGFANPVLIYTLYRNGPRPTVADFARILDLAKRHGFKGVWTVLPRG